MNELASGQKEAELAADLAALRADVERRHNQGRERRRDEGEQLTQLANHNQRLVEQLAEVSAGRFLCAQGVVVGRGRVLGSAVQSLKRM